MGKTAAPLLAVLGLCLAAGPTCGRKGPLVTPKSGAPGPVRGLAAAAGEGGIVLRWTVPARTVAGRPLGPLAAVEVWIFDRGLPAGPGRLDDDAVEKTARRARRIPREEFAALWGPGGEAAGVMTYVHAPAGGAEAAPAFAVRVVDRKGRVSAFAGPVAVEPVRRSPGGRPSGRSGCMLAPGGRP